LLQRGALGFQAPDDLVVSLLGLAFESCSTRLGVFGNIRRLRSRVGQKFLGIASSAVGVRLGISGYLLCHGSRIRHSLAGFPSSIFGVRERVPGYLLCRCSRRGTDIVGLMLSAGDMLVGCSLSQSQYLEGLTLGVWIGKAGRWVHVRVVWGRSSEQPLDPASDPAIGHSATSVLERSSPRRSPDIARLPD
jgi:hypothetical protein